MSVDTRDSSVEVDAGDDIDELMPASTYGLIADAADLHADSAALRWIPGTQGPTMTESNVELYIAPGTCSLAAQVAMGLAGIACELRLVDLYADRSAYRALNPSGKVPALRIDGEVVTENLAIIGYCDAIAGGQLLPKEPIRRAQCLAFLAWCGNHVHIARRQARVPRHFVDDEALHAPLMLAGRERFADALDQIDRRLESRKWLFTEVPGGADAYALVFFDWAVRDEQPVERWTHYAAMVRSLVSVGPVQRALKDHESPLLEWRA